MSRLPESVRERLSYCLDAAKSELRKEMDIWNEELRHGSAPVDEEELADLIGKFVKSDAEDDDFFEVLGETSRGDLERAVEQESRDEIRQLFIGKQELKATLESKLEQHLEEVHQWCSEVVLRDMVHAKKVHQIYVDLETYVIPREMRIEDEELASIPLDLALLTKNDHCLLQGQPGAGKTTSTKKLCWNFFEDPSVVDFRIPVLIRLRDLASSDSSIVDSLLRLVRPVFTNSQTTVELPAKQRDLCLTLLDRMQALLILEGYDELPNVAAKETVLKEIMYLVRRFSRSKILITCRTAEIQASLPQTRTYEIAPLTIAQIRMFAGKWIEDSGKAKLFVDEVLGSPFADTAIKPLMLANLCAIFERTQKVPTLPKTVYRKVVSLLTEEWDEQRMIRVRENKVDFLSNLAYELTKMGLSTFETNQILEAYGIICGKFDLPEDAGNLVLREVEANTGLIIKSASDRFEFLHKSIQEYLTAEHLVKLPSLRPMEHLLMNMPSELAIATALSSDSSGYFVQLVSDSLNKIRNASFFEVFLDRTAEERAEFEDTDEFVLCFFSLLEKIPSQMIRERVVQHFFDRVDSLRILQFYEVKRGKVRIELEKKSEYENFEVAPRLSIVLDSPLAVVFETPKLDPSSSRLT